jgi:creatinine amidohydrolase/Fe(II)-dependent formamide hydrolase-like protein
MPGLVRFFAACLRVLFAVAGGAARAAATAPGADSVYLEELTWTELRDRIQAGATTAIVPVGGTEQSGPHLALGKHNARVRVLAGRIAAALGNAVVAPVMAYVPEGAVDPPAGHMRFPGTLTVPEAAFETTLEYAARSLRRAGFRDIVLIGDHGGYQKSLVRVAGRLDREWAATPVRVHAIGEYYRAADVDYAAALRRAGHADAEIGSHAGLADTALSLALDPQGVRPGRLHDGAAPGVAQGVQGDPRRASAALGQFGADLVVARTVEAIRRDVGRP